MDEGTEDVLAEAATDQGSTDLDRALEAPSLQDATAFLLLGPIGRSIEDEACTSLIGREPLEERNLLFVSLTQSASDRIQILREQLGELPAEICVVSDADDYASETVVGTQDGPVMTVDVVSDPSDLPRLGMKISKAADGWETDRPMVVCFHSLTALLQYAEPRRVFRFVHLLQNRLDATMHFHMDADAHDEQTIATLRPLFDVVVEYDATGDVTVMG